MTLAFSISLNARPQPVSGLTATLQSFQFQEQWSPEVRASPLQAVASLRHLKDSYGSTC